MRSNCSTEEVQPEEEVWEFMKLPPQLWDVPWEELNRFTVKRQSTMHRGRFRMHWEQVQAHHPHLRPFHRLIFRHRLIRQF